MPIDGDGDLLLLKTSWRHLELGVTHHLVHRSAKTLHIPITDPHDHLHVNKGRRNKKNGIKELGGLSNLQGSLLIKNLENVTTSDEASDASIIDKKHINSLHYKWSECDNNKRQFQIETDVLCKLQPRHELKTLTISGYQGTRFLDWVGNCYFHSMTWISLNNCNKCDMLPSLGQLPSLKQLCISKLNSVKAIDIGFYKNQDCSFVKPFPSLVNLIIVDMLCLKVWSSFDSDAFPLLKVLEIRNCPKFRGDLPNRLPSLESLAINGMPCWETWSSLTLDAFPLLERLNIRRCPKLMGNLPNQLPALNYLNITDCELLVSTLPRAPVLRRLTISKSNKVVLDVFPLSVEDITVEGSPMVEYMIEVIGNVQPTSLRYLCINDSWSAISFPCGRLPASLQTLTIGDCKKLEFPLQYKHELLESLSIFDSCDSLTSLSLINFPNLTHLSIQTCENLESLSVSGSESLMKLSYFVIHNCPNFVSFPREGLTAPNLIHFRVENCDKLKALPNQMNVLLPKLEYLGIHNCPEIELFPERGMPPNLRSIEIENCEKLLSDLARASMDKLTDLTLRGPFDGIKSFPKEVHLQLQVAMAKIVLSIMVKIRMENESRAYRMYQSCFNWETSQCTVLNRVFS
ncbi:hypothetical protein Fmac_012360 [Flemingia macrophylla]|uniref:R13L1/DRL21-like LRR repeat region domain-containing protein n=1 Tax=Flemingia macrophylla TaxID=520843 RepID=A0ABD1MQ42_9FABA